ncbi:MAG: helix-turn-helix domain-containing protein [Bacillota bacterium]
MNNLGNFLRKLRGKMSLREAASRSGLSHTYIRDLELGMNRSTNNIIQPSPETLEKLASAYSYSYEGLMKAAGYLHSENPPVNSHVEQHSYDLLEILKNHDLVKVGHHTLSDRDAKMIRDILDSMFLKYPTNP